MYEKLKKNFTKLLALISKQDVIPNHKDFKKLDKNWLNNKQNLLDTHEMEIGLATQASLKDIQITSGKKQTFFAEKTPMWYSFIRSSTWLALRNIGSNKKSGSKFKALSDGLYHI